MALASPMLLRSWKHVHRAKGAPRRKASMLESTSGHNAVLGAAKRGTCSPTQSAAALSPDSRSMLQVSPPLSPLMMVHPILLCLSVYMPCMLLC